MPLQDGANTGALPTPSNADGGFCTFDENQHTLTSSPTDTHIRVAHGMPARQAPPQASDDQPQSSLAIARNGKEEPISKSHADRLTIPSHGALGTNGTEACMIFDPTPNGRTLADAVSLAMIQLQGRERTCAEQAAAHLSTLLGKPSHDITTDEFAPDNLRDFVTQSRLGLSVDYTQRTRRYLRGLHRLVSAAPAEHLRVARRLAATTNHSLADVFDAVAIQPDWTAKLKRDVAAAVARVAGAINFPPDKISARESEIRASLEGATHLDLGVGSGSRAAVVSRCLRGVRLLDRNGRQIRSSRLTGSLRKLWKALEVEYTDADEEWRLRRLWPIFGRAADRQIEISGIPDEIVLWFADLTGSGKGTEQASKAISQWNDIVASGRFGAFPHLTSPKSPVRSKSIGLGELSAEVRDEWMAYERDRAKTNDPENCVRDRTDRLLAPRTLESHRHAFLGAATIAIRNGADPASLTSIKSIVTATIAEALLARMEADRRKVARLRGIAHPPPTDSQWTVVNYLGSIARYVGADPTEIAALRKLSRARRPFERDGSRMGLKNATRLMRFNDEDTLLAWFDAPATLLQRAERLRAKGDITAASIVDVEIALAGQMVQEVPARPENLVGTRLYGPTAHFVRGLQARRWATVLYPAEEVKNYNSIEMRFSPLTVDLAMHYIKYYRPVKMQMIGSDPHNIHLFPGVGLEPRAVGGFSRMFSDRYRRVAGIVCSMQLGRHIAAKIILDLDENAIGTVSLLLGHKSEETTRKFYARVRALSAQSKYLAIIKAHIDRFAAVTKPTRGKDSNDL
jgi:hypothetical protein